MVNNKSRRTMSKIAFFLICIILISLIPKQINAYYDVDIPKQAQIFVPDQTSGLITFQPVSTENSEKRYIVFGSGPISDITQSADSVIYELNSGHGSFAVGIFNPNEIS